MHRTIFLARHGESAWNAEQRIQGQQDSGLSILGFRHRRALFYYLRDQPLTRIYASQLSRAIQTALPLARHLNCPLESCAELNELAFGLLEGEALSELDEWAAGVWAWWQADPVNHRIPGGGESYLDLLERADRFLLRLDANRRDARVLIVAHFRINQMLFGRLAGLDLLAAVDTVQDHNCVYRIEQETGQTSSIERVMIGQTPLPPN